MLAVRRLLGTAGLTAVLALAPAGASFAATPTPDPTATASASASASAAPSPAASTPAPIPSESIAPSPSESPSPGGCDQNPVICQGGGVPGGTTTDCGQLNDGGIASPPPPGVICIAGGIRPGTTPAGGNVGAGAPHQLPRTGPAPLLPTVTIGMWLVLLGVLLGLVGRRRTARA